MCVFQLGRFNRTKLQMVTEVRERNERERERKKYTRRNAMQQTNKDTKTEKHSHTKPQWV